ncbi:hypothetical protein HXX76_013275 [Chlamydomonas incerta]|uniref:cyclin-dependent kinase n=1 Tax=Chlamydomonas incerta TaxID=51695 RepID=A0A835VR40_CHLIN|nr:hypothetical protein HXX76_013275 [Chlamydomonas incerta]|eukprot:KAG2426087.1 hypothetical protein HXX76_013275 [Chlamydomonas incerta]
MQRSYDFVSVIDEGAYGTVFACVQQPAGTVVAIKQCKHATDPLVRRLLLREIRILRSLPRHPCVVALLDAFRSQSSGRPHLVFERMERSLHKDMDARGCSPDAQQQCSLKTKLVAWQLLQGLAHLHANKVVHRDIKPANVLLSGDGAATLAKLCDFGFAREVASGRPEAQERMSSYVVTRWYRAPEILVGDRYGMAADVWSLGCTLAEMAAGGVPLFPGASTLDQLARIMRCCGPLPPGQTLCLHTDKRLAPLRKPPPRSRNLAERLKGIDPHLLDLISSCLTLDPARRPSARALLGARYFRDVPLLLAGSPLAADLAPLLEPEPSRSPPPPPQSQTHAAAAAESPPVAATSQPPPQQQQQRAASKRAHEEAAAGGGSGGGGAVEMDSLGAAGAASRKRPSDFLPQAAGSSHQAVNSMQTKAASDSLIGGSPRVAAAAPAGAVVAAAAAAPAAAGDAAGEAPLRGAGTGAHARISEVKPASSVVPEGDAAEGDAAAASGGAQGAGALPGPRPSYAGGRAGATGPRPSYAGGRAGATGPRPSYASGGGFGDPNAPDRWASTVSEPPPRGYPYDRTVSIGVDGLSAPTGADTRSALQSGVLGSDLVIVGRGGSSRDVVIAGGIGGGGASSRAAAAAAVAMAAVSRHQIPDGTERMLQPLPSGSELPPLLPPAMPQLQPLDAPLDAPPIPMQPHTRPRGGTLGLDGRGGAPTSADGTSSSKLRQLLLQPFMVSGGSGSAALGAMPPPAAATAAAAAEAANSSTGGGGGGGVLSSSSFRSLRAAGRSHGLPLLAVAPHEIAAAADEAATRAAGGRRPMEGVVMGDGTDGTDDEESIEATVAALLSANPPGQDNSSLATRRSGAAPAAAAGSAAAAGTTAAVSRFGSAATPPHAASSPSAAAAGPAASAGAPATAATAATAAAARMPQYNASVLMQLRASPRAASAAAARRSSCVAVIGGGGGGGMPSGAVSAAASSSAASNGYDVVDGLVTLGSPAPAAAPPPALASSSSAGGGSYEAVAAAAAAAAGVAAGTAASGRVIRLGGEAVGGEAAATAAVPTPASAVAAAALAAGLALRRPAREQRVAAGGPPRVVRASASMVEFVPPAPWLTQQQYQLQQAGLARHNTAGGGGGALAEAGAGAGNAGSGAGTGGTAPGTGGGTGPGTVGSGLGGSSTFGGLSLVATNQNANAAVMDVSKRILSNLDFSMLPDLLQQQQQGGRALQPPAGGATAPAAIARPDSTANFLSDILASPAGAPPALPPGGLLGHNLSLRRPGAAGAAAAAAAAAAAGHRPPPPPLVHMPHVRGGISTTASSVAALVAGTPTFVSVSQMYGSSTAVYDSVTLPGAYNYSSASAAAAAAAAGGGGGAGAGGGVGGGSAMAQYAAAEPYHETLYEDEDGGDGGSDFKGGSPGDGAPPRLLQAHMELFVQQQPLQQQRKPQLQPPLSSWDHQRGPTPSSVSTAGCLNSDVATANGGGGGTPAARVSQMLELAGELGAASLLESGSGAQKRSSLLQQQQQAATGLQLQPPFQAGSSRLGLAGVPVAPGSMLPGMEGSRSGGGGGGGGGGYVIGVAAAAVALSGGGGGGRLSTGGNSGSGSRMRVGEVMLGAPGSSSRVHARPLGAMPLDVLREEPTESPDQRSAALHAAQEHAAQQQLATRQQLQAGTAAAISTASVAAGGATSPAAAAPLLHSRASSRLGPQSSRLSRSATDAALAGAAAATAAPVSAGDVAATGAGAGTGAGAMVPNNSGWLINGASVGVAGPASGQALSRFATELQLQQLPSGAASAGYVRATSAAGGTGDQCDDEAGGDAAPSAGASAGAAAASRAASSRLPAPAAVAPQPQQQPQLATAPAPAAARPPAAAPAAVDAAPAAVTAATATGASGLEHQQPPPPSDACAPPAQQQQQPERAPGRRASSGLGGLLARLFACGRGSAPSE